LAVVILLVALAVGGFVWWALTPLGPSQDAIAALTSDAEVRVEQTDAAIYFRPAHDGYRVGLVLYPGGRVDERSYAPLARSVAERGYLVAIARMPLHLAVFGPDAADSIISAEEAVETWAIGGHSLGGAMAAAHIEGTPANVRGLVLLAAYPPDSTDLSDRDLDVLSLYGTQDRVVDATRLEASQRRLPSDSRFIALEGGNHAQFGSYGPQPGDGEATMTAEVQLEETTREILSCLLVLRIRTP
jgi:pimeloyl-ACP methyl ester carboxylesterase